MHTIPTLLLISIGMVSAANTCTVVAPTDHTSCAALTKACEDGGAGTLAWARTTTLEGGQFRCANNADAAADTACEVEVTGALVDTGHGFTILEGKGLHYTIGVVATCAVLYLVAMLMEKHDADDAPMKARKAAEKEKPLSACSRFVSFAKLFLLRRTGYVKPDGLAFSFFGMVRNTQPWELLYCYTCGHRFSCASESVKKHWLRWATFYYSLCLSTGLSIMFSALLLSDAAKGCFFPKVEWYDHLPLSTFTETYLLVMALCKVSDTSVGYLTAAATQRSNCVSQAVRWGCIAVGLLFVAAALYFQYGVTSVDDLDFTVAEKVWAYGKMVLITRGAVWVAVTPVTTLLCYWCGKCLYTKPEGAGAGAAGAAEEQGMSLTGMYDRMGGSSPDSTPPPSVDDDGAAPHRAARSTLAPDDWAAQQRGGAPVVGMPVGGGGGGAPISREPSAPSWNERPVSADLSYV